MNIISKIKMNKKENTPIKIVINSEFDYKDHDLNVLKECLNIWSKDMNSCKSAFKYDWIYTNPDQKEKVFFLSTTIGELKRHKLTKLIDNKDVIANSYMTELQNRFIFNPPINNVY